MSLAGTRLGPYDVVSLLGAGGMGEVYRARDTRLGREVAIKVLPTEIANDPVALARFEREARAVASLSHPNILSIFDIGEHSGLRFAVMELVAGDTLRAMLMEGPIPPRRALEYGAQIAEALAAAHERGVVHRDVKPENVIVTPDGRVKVLDFGLAKSTIIAPDLATGSVQLQTDSGKVLGTVGYMSPEQVRGLAVDHRSDIFSLGIVLYEMLGGQRAFRGDSAVETMHAILRDEPPQLSSSGAQVSPAIEQVVAHCLEKNPAARFQSARDLVFALRNTAQTTSATASPMRAGARISRREMVAWSVAGLASAALVPLALRSTRPAGGDRLVRFQVLPPLGATRDTFDAFALSPDGNHIVFRAQAAGKYRLWLRSLAATEAEVVRGSEEGDSPFWSPDSGAIAFFTSTALLRVDLRGRDPQRICSVKEAAGGCWGEGDIIVFGDSGRGLFRVAANGGSPQQLTTIDSSARERGHAWPQFLPDGKSVVFLAMTEAYDSNTLWVQSLDGSPRTELVKSPLGAVLANGYLLRRASGGIDLTTMVAQPLDAAAKRIAGPPRVIRQGLPNRNTEGVGAASASQNGVLAISSPDHRQSLVWMDRAGRELARLGPVANIWSFALAPDESRVAAAIVKKGEEVGDIWLLDPKRSSGVQLTFRGALRPLWSRDGRGILFSNYDLALPMRAGLGNGVYRLSLGMPGVQPIDRGERVFLYPHEMTPDGKTLIAGTVTTSETVIAVDLETAASRVLVQDEHGAAQPRVSPDGKWIAYTLMLPNRAEVFAQSLAGGVRTQLSVDGGFSPVWRDDARELYYQSFDGTLMCVGLHESGGQLNATDVTPLFRVRTGGFGNDDPTDIAVAAHGQKFLVNTVLGDSDNVPIEITMNWPELLKESKT